ncbi:hypothetical protein B0A55_00842 [Friedmanniomyces simplex]|uniref:Uncharacterized protein n=1 Tax=Friedmanniomyces simplex TaxID=329884 RepID=A0A4U0Y0Y2_9PEZI|nr:hypothetical protein B0A55_00842 [Friedmanniomyces simplex]
MVALGQTITIVNKSGKIVKSSKHLVNVWNEAKSAYNERKAEIKALRKDEAQSKDRELKARKRLEVLTLEDDGESRASSRQSSRSRRDDGPQTSKPRTERPLVERGYTDSFYADDSQVARRSPRPSPLRHDSHGSFRTTEPRAGELTRRHTTDLQLHHQRPATPTRSASLDDIDMDLAYGELPPPLPERKYDTEVELRSKMSGLQTLLDECNCFQHSVTAIIDNLQKNPDALAAVALTLGEISTLASKMAPGALMSMKGAFPVIVAILASPEFAIAVGVGVGVTIIALGGYKIIKKIKAKKEARLLENGELGYPPAIEASEPESPMEELREIDRIELWRRGIADVGDGAAGEGSAVGTSVEGEFITPAATRTLIEEGRLTEADLKSTVGGKEEKKRRRKGVKTAAAGSEQGSKNSSGGKSKVKVKAKKEGSLLKQLFTKSA